MGKGQKQSRLGKAWPYRVALGVSLLALSACGGDDGKGGSLFGFGASDNIAALPVSTHPAAGDAGRFLTQATFGPTDASIASLSASTYDDWLTAQFALPQTSHLAAMEARLKKERLTNPDAYIDANDFYDSFWQQAVTGDDQLRQRVAFALSEIFVTSFSNANVDARGIADYYDMLERDAFGNYRDLLQDVSMHPMMGIFLSSLGNQKEDPATGRHPDENYAREIMQLMSIGLYKLNIDGTKQLDILGNPQPSYSQDDIHGLARVFTGFSWYSATPDDGTFYGWPRDDNSSTHAMIAYNAYHSTSDKEFLGVTIPANPTPNAKYDLKIALDTIFNNPNVGPFISKQLIQRLVTSNPSPAYVKRVALIFNNNGAGVRGDLKAVVRAILTDREARDVSNTTSPSWGKLREPVVRVAHVLRAYKATSVTGNWTMGSTDGWLKQSPMTSPSVFNFWRPGYVPPNTTLGDNNLTAPEFQAINEITVANYVNGMQYAVSDGLGDWISNSAGRDIKINYTDDYVDSGDPNRLVAKVNRLFLNGTISDGLKSRIITALLANDPTKGNASQQKEARFNRIRTAILLTVASPEYIAQR